MALTVQPRVEMIAHLDEIESGPLGCDGLSDDLPWPEALSGQFVSDVHCSSSRAIPTVVSGVPVGSLGKRPVGSDRNSIFCECRGVKR
jgi:hypothetical protein